MRGRLGGAESSSSSGEEVLPAGAEERMAGVVVDGDLEAAAGLMIASAVAASGGT